MAPSPDHGKWASESRKGLSFLAKSACARTRRGIRCTRRMWRTRRRGVEANPKAKASQAPPKWASESKKGSLSLVKSACARTRCSIRRTRHARRVQRRGVEANFEVKAPQAPPQNGQARAEDPFIVVSGIGARSSMFDNVALPVMWACANAHGRGPRAGAEPTRRTVPLLIR